MVDSYMTIQETRFEDRIRFSVSVEENLLDIRIIKFILQPLTENAINHGIVPKKNGGSITLHIWREDADILITVEDDGVGFETDGESIPAKGYALRNIDERLKLYYGDGYGLKITSSPGHGTSVRVRLKTAAPDPVTVS